MTGQGLIDRFQRRITYLRVSVTDRCNMRCMYCLGERPQWLPASEILSFEEIERLVRLFVALGIKKIRLTGGEPLVRPGVLSLVERLSLLKSEGLERLVLTSNGFLLKKYILDLKKAGLDRINISLDSLRREKFNRITRREAFDLVWEGIEQALEVGLHPVKINVVLMKGINDDEIEDFARLTLERPLHVRFIELMPHGMGLSLFRQQYFPVAQAFRKCQKVGDLYPTEMNFQSGEAPHSAYGGSSTLPPPATARLRPKRGRETTENPRPLGIEPAEAGPQLLTLNSQLQTLDSKLQIPNSGLLDFSTSRRDIFPSDPAGPAQIYHLPDALGSMGFISPISRNFCQACNRVRLSATGFLKLCLDNRLGVDLKTLLRQGMSENDIKERIRRTIYFDKPERHSMDDSSQVRTVETSEALCSIGG